VVSGLKQAGVGTNGHEHRDQINICYKQTIVLWPLSLVLILCEYTTSAQLLLALLY
jgi:hypothetical protein